MRKIEKQRYILFKIIMEDKNVFKQEVFLNYIWQSIWKYFGMKQANKIGLWLIELDLTYSFGILRCSNETKEEVISSLTFIKQIDGNRVIISPIKTSSTIKKIKKLKHQMIETIK